VGDAFLHNTFWPVQHVAPSPELLVAIWVSPGRHWPLQKGAVPRHVSAFAVAASGTIIETIMMRFTKIFLVRFLLCDMRGPPFNSCKIGVVLNAVIVELAWVNLTHF